MNLFRRCITSQCIYYIYKIKFKKKKGKKNSTYFIPKRFSWGRRAGRWRLGHCSIDGGRWDPTAVVKTEEDGAPIKCLVEREDAICDDGTTTFEEFSEISRGRDIYTHTVSDSQVCQITGTADVSNTDYLHRDHRNYIYLGFWNLIVLCWFAP